MSCWLGGVITIWANHNKTGRYSCSWNGSGFVIFDTKTSELWVRATEATAYFGTIKEPKFEIIEIDKEKFIARKVAELAETEKAVNEEFERITDELIPDEAKDIDRQRKELEDELRRLEGNKGQ